MPGRAADAVAATPSGIGIVHALGAERVGFGETQPAPIVMQSGPGGERAARAAEAAVDAGAGALLSWGLAGGLEPGLLAGVIVVPGRLVADDGGELASDRTWSEALRRVLAADFVVHDGALLSASDVLATPREKARAALATGAVAIDLESAAIGRVAARHGLPFAAIRVVADTVSDALPPGVASWVDDAGEQRLGAVMRAALRPAVWPGLLMLARRYRVARGTLSAAAEQLVARGFARPGG